VYNIQKAVSRLDYAPKLKEIEVTDIQKGLGVFAPKPDKPVSFAALKATLKSAGYVLDAAEISVAGTLNKEGDPHRRDGFRMGHEQRLNTDLEYVLLPREYKKPGGELFLILETTFVHRGTGRLNSAPVAGSKATEYYLAPGLQYAARPRFVVEGSVQFPVVRNTGPLTLRTDVNVLLGVKYLF